MYPIQKQGFYPDIIFEVFCFLTRFQLAYMEPISYFLHKLIILHFKTRPYYLLKEISCSYDSTVKVYIFAFFHAELKL